MNRSDVLTFDEAVPLLHASVDALTRRHDLRALFIKGPVAVGLDLRPLRSSIDVDVLVDPASFDRFCAALEPHGWIPNYDADHPPPRRSLRSTCTR